MHRVVHDYAYNRARSPLLTDNYCLSFANAAILINFSVTQPFARPPSSIGYKNRSEWKWIYNFFTSSYFLLIEEIFYDFSFRRNKIINFILIFLLDEKEETRWNTSTPATTIVQMMSWNCSTQGEQQLRVKGGCATLTIRRHGGKARRKTGRR